MEKKLKEAGLLMDRVGTEYTVCMLSILRDLILDHKKRNQAFLYRHDLTLVNGYILGKYLHC